MNTLLIVNPSSGAALNPDFLPELLELFKRQNLEVDVELTTPEEDGQKLAAVAGQNGTQLIVVAGGDGTLAAVAQGLINTQTVLGIIPMGTRNNLAASLNIPNDLTKAVRVIFEGEICAIDLGKVNEHYFLEVVGVGLEASLFPSGEEIKEAIKKKHLSGIKGFFIGLKTFFKFTDHRVFLRLDGKAKRYLRTLQINICNSPRYGVEFTLAPNAKLDDGKLDVVYINHPSKWDHLCHFLSAMRGQIFVHERLRAFQATQIEVKSDLPLEVHADGICIGNTPITVQIVPQALKVMIPTSTLLREFANKNSTDSSTATTPNLS